ncbi:MAG: glycoside hydrolase family 99-like domain-containing protein [Acidobacteriaceae bacterium]|nr:glycoside hydrolase family 99-like domain-containing protein [Acidobacteriaceae bacterium]
MANVLRRDVLKDIGTAAVVVSGFNAQALDNNRPYEVAAYYFGNYHVDKRNEAAHGPGWTEWRLVQAARPRFAGHQQPKVPLWGYEDEAQPKVFERKIEAASRSGVRAFIFDWYWYNDGSFLEGALERGYLQAHNKTDLKFALMWANHDWFDIQPAKLSGHPLLQFEGAVTPQTFDALTDHIVKVYFSEPSYWFIDGCPYFSIYEIYRFVKGMGGVRNAAGALEAFRAKTRKAGFKDLHLNAVTWGVQLLPGETEVTDLKALLAALSVNSTTSYVWIHHVKMRPFPVAQYEEVARSYEEYRAGAAAKYNLPYFPNVSMGWDATPRVCQTDLFVEGQYPFISVLQGNTPQAFERALNSAKNFVDRQASGLPRVLTINAWNEWTEGSYLEPDTVNGMAYLNAIKKVFAT